jgi:hypothetical protein
MHIPALRNFNAGMCLFCFPSFRGLETALRIENGGLMIGKTATRVAWTASAIPLKTARNQQQKVA